MKSATLEDWEPSAPYIIAQLLIAEPEVLSLCNGVEIIRPDGGHDEVAVFKLDDGRVVALAKVDNNSVDGFTLITNGQVDRDAILAAFLREAALSASVVTWMPAQRHGYQI